MKEEKKQKIQDSVVDEETKLEKENYETLEKFKQEYEDTCKIAQENLENFKKLITIPPVWVLVLYQYR